MMPHYTPQTLADHWGVSRATVYREIDRGRLKVVRIGSNIRIPVRFVEEYEEFNTTSEDDPRSQNGSVGTLSREHQIGHQLRAFARARRTRPVTTDDDSAGSR